MKKTNSKKCVFATTIWLFEPFTEHWLIRDSFRCGSEMMATVSFIEYTGPTGILT